MNAAIIGETSGRVRDAFIRRGHTAVSCDLLDTDAPGPHIKSDCRDYDFTQFDLLVCHPPCTYLCNSGVRWLHDDAGRWFQMFEAADLFKWMMDQPNKFIAIENPVMHKYARRVIGRGPDFTIQPWQFGDDFKKRTCFWTKGLSALSPTSDLDGKTAVAECHNASPGKDRWKKRSVTYPGIADAIADQWGSYIDEIARKEQADE